jgi:GAF domain/ANTAR domain
MTTPDERRASVRALVAAEPRGPDDGVWDGAAPDGAAPDGASPDGASPGTVAWLRRLCRAAVRSLSVNGVGISVMTATGVHAVAAASDPPTEALEGLQITLGEGPCIDAFTTRRPVLAPDLAAEAAHRWPAYSAAALENGASAVFAFPLQVGAARLGVLGVYRHSPGPLSGPSLVQALTFAEVTVETLLVGQGRAPQGRTEATLDQALSPQYTVYQAQGMAMVDLGVSLSDAMARLQAYAYAHDRLLHDVARDVVSGRLRLEPESP